MEGHFGDEREGGCDAADRGKAVAAATQTGEVRLCEEWRPGNVKKRASER